MFIPTQLNDKHVFALKKNSLALQAPYSSCTKFLEMYGKWTCIHDFSSTHEIFQPLLIFQQFAKQWVFWDLVPHGLVRIINVILRFGSIVHDSRISTMCTKWDNQCSELQRPLYTYPKSQVTWGQSVPSQPLRAWKLRLTTSHGS